MEQVGFSRASETGSHIVHLFRTGKEKFVYFIPKAIFFLFVCLLFSCRNLNFTKCKFVLQEFLVSFKSAVQIAIVSLWALTETVI